MERNLPIPDPGHREILVKVEAVGVCASDGKCYSGAEVYWGKPGGLELIFKKKRKKKKMETSIMYTYSRFLRKLKLDNPKKYFW